MISDDEVLSLSTRPLFMALDSDRLQPYLTFPTQLTDAEWREWVTRVAPPYPDDYCSPDHVACDGDRRIFYDPNRTWYSAGRYILGLAVLESAQAVLNTSDGLTDLMIELDPASFEALAPEARSVWVRFWQILGYDGGDTLIARSEQPFWITQAYEGDYAALTAPAELAAIVTAMQEQQILDWVMPTLTAAGFDEAETLRHLLKFMQQTAQAQQWLLGLAAAT